MLPSSHDTRRNYDSSSVTSAARLRDPPQHRPRSGRLPSRARPPPRRAPGADVPLRRSTRATPPRPARRVHLRRLRLHARPRRPRTHGRLPRNPWLGEALHLARENKVLLSLICHAPVAMTSTLQRVDGEGRAYRVAENPFLDATITTLSKHSEKIALRAGYVHVPGQRTRLTYYVDEALKEAGFTLRTGLNPSAVKLDLRARRPSPHRQRPAGRRRPSRQAARDPPRRAAANNPGTLRCSLIADTPEGSRALRWHHSGACLRLTRELAWHRKRSH
jgi:hypothetical protein